MGLSAGVSTVEYAQYATLPLKIDAPAKRQLVLVTEIDRHLFAFIECQEKVNASASIAMRTEQTAHFVSRRSIREPNGNLTNDRSGSPA
jgi:hypothetical protein